jgi:zinc transporter ZupT
MLKYGDPFFFGVLIPLGALLVVALVPYITPGRLSPAELGRWFPRGGRNIQVLVAALAGMIILLTLLALLT